MSDDEAKRAALLKKLQNPAWIEEKEQEYDRIVGSDKGFPIILDLRLPAYPEILEFTGGSVPVFDEPTTIDGLWLDRWQRSSGAFTITRMPDDTILLDYPTGARYTYRLVRSSNSGYSWTAEEFDLVGKRINSRRSTDRYETRDEALFEMHRAALSEFDDLTNDY
jgi:hypothetical protein